ncbi:Ribokinase-like protein [Nemania sp. FL0031]|nr:Ribokinase-like protein [Nemania sp. FL0031]
MASRIISIIGGLDADLIMIADRTPDWGESVLANEYLEALGGKGANSAIATYRTCHRKLAGKLLDNEELKKSTDNLYAKPAQGQSPLLAPQQPGTKDDYEDNICVKMIGAVGDDRYGEEFITELSKNGVDVSGIVTVAHTRTSICFVTVDERTRENKCLFTLGATATWKKEHFMKPEDLGGGMRPDLVVAQMEIDKEVVEKMIETAGKVNIDFCLNAAPATPISEETYSHITHLLVNESEAAIMSGRRKDEVNEDTWSIIAQEFLERGVQNVVLTLGAKGAFYANSKESGHCLAFDVDVVDSTGAGDAFTGAYAAAYLRQKAKGQWNIRSAVIRSSKAASIAIQAMGAQAGIPWGDEIDNFDAPLKRLELPPPTSTTSVITTLE